MVLTHNLCCRQRVHTDSAVGHNLEDIYSYAIPGNDIKPHSLY